MHSVKQKTSFDAVHMNFDDSAPLGMGSNSAALLATRLAITVKTSHDEAHIQALVAQVVEKDTFFLALRNE